MQWNINCYCTIIHSVCMKRSGFPYVLLTGQEVRVYLVAMITLQHALASEWKKRMHVKYTMLATTSTTAHLYEAPLISAYGVGPPKVTWPRDRRLAMYFSKESASKLNRTLFSYRLNLFPLRMFKSTFSLRMRITKRMPVSVDACLRVCT